MSTRTTLFGPQAFTAADATNVSTLISGVEQDGVNGFVRVFSNQFGNGFSTTSDVCLPSGPTYTTQQYAKCTIIITSAGANDRIGVNVMNNAGAFNSNSMYRVLYRNSSTSAVVVMKVVNNVETQVGTDITVTFASGDALWVEADASSGTSTIIEVFQNTTSLGTRTDSTSPLTTGRPGITATRSGDGTRGDDYEAGSWVASVPFSLPLIHVPARPILRL